MYSASDFEKLWFLYKTEGEPKGISLNSFCASHGVSFNPSEGMSPEEMNRYIQFLFHQLEEIKEELRRANTTIERMPPNRNV